MYIDKDKAMESLRKVPIVYAGSEGFVVDQKAMFHAISDLPEEDGYIEWLEKQLIGCETYTKPCKNKDNGWCYMHCEKGQPRPDSECLRHAYEMEQSIVDNCNDLLTW